MSNLEKVIFDTNIIRNTEPKTFLGGRDELKKFSKVVEIIFPDMVIEELKRQKQRQLEKHKKTFLENSFHWLRGVDKEDTESFDNEEYIKDLESKEDIKYSVIKLQDYSVLEQIKDLALKKLAPFEESENTDKGFKDAYIYFTILEYLQTIPDKYVFVYTGDGRLKLALSKHSNIKLISTFEEYKNQSIYSFKEKYFVEKLQLEIDPLIEESSITKFWTNDTSVYFLEIYTIFSKYYIVEVESGEILSKKLVDYREAITSLVDSEKFGDTHALCKKILPDLKYLTDEEAQVLFLALLNNPQVRGAYGYSVKELYLKLFDLKKDNLEEYLLDRLNAFKPSDFML